MRILKLLLVIIGVIWVGIFIYLRNPAFAFRSANKEKYLDPKALKAHVEALSSITPARMFQNPKSMLEAEAFIQKQLESSGYKVRLQEVQSDENVFHNIIARYGDENAKDLIVVGAHYDVAGNKNPGADDNGSGVAVLLEIAKAFKAHQAPVDTAIEFVAYTLEEPPYFGTKGMGSSYHAESLSKQNVNVKFMLSLEMLGYYSEDLFSQSFPIPFLYVMYPWKGNFIALVTLPTDRKLTRTLKNLMAKNMDTKVYSINAPAFVQGIDFSDHRNYWEYEWPAFMITDTAFLRNTQYHEAEDTPDRLNYEKMADVGDGIYQTLKSNIEL